MVCGVKSKNGGPNTVFKTEHPPYLEFIYLKLEFGNMENAIFFLSK